MHAKGNTKSNGKKQKSTKRGKLTSDKKSTVRRGTSSTTSTRATVSSFEKDSIDEDLPNAHTRSTPNLGFSNAKKSCRKKKVIKPKVKDMEIPSMTFLSEKIDNCDLENVDQHSDDSACAKSEDALRWKNECSDPEEELNRIYNYKAERRKRYVNAMYKKIYC